MAKIRVMIVDDSAVVRQAIRQNLEKAADIEVIGAVADPLFALERMKNHWPDVITLDIEMPRMDGITFLRKIMAEHPTPVVICSSSLADKDGRTTMEALAAGAVAFITKPRQGVKRFLEDASDDLLTAVRSAARANVRNIRPGAAGPAAAPKLSADAMLAAHAASAAAMAPPSQSVVAIGTSTGGTQALEVVLTELPPVCPGIVVVQHMPVKFTTLFAERLNTLCQVEVREARHNDRVMPGRVLIAPGGRHMLLQRSGSEYTVKVADGPLVNRHKPSVDVLFRSVAQVAGANALGIIMTGMGDDGARGLHEMHEAGARTVAQDEASCVVFGMPKEAIKLGGVDKIIPLEQVAREILAYAQDGNGRATGGAPVQGRVTQHE